MIVDCHSHVDFKDERFRYTPQEFVAGMDEGGIDVSVVLAVDHADHGCLPAWAKLSRGPTTKKGWSESPSLMPVPTGHADEEVAAFCGAYPDRLVGVGSVHPDRHRPDLKVEWLVKELGLRGVKLYPHSGFFPNDPRLDRVYDKCVTLDIPVMIHTGIKALPWQHIRYNDPINVDDVAADFPELRIAMLHGGFPWTDQFLTVAYSNPNIWVDLTFLDVIARTFGREELIESTVRQLVDFVGSERLMWGTEGPYFQLQMYGGWGPENYASSQETLVKRFDFLSEQDRANILGGTAAKFFGIAQRTGRDPA